jgi:hypothetical protein
MTNANAPTKKHFQVSDRGFDIDEMLTVRDSPLHAEVMKAMDQIFETLWETHRSNQTTIVFVEGISGAAALSVLNRMRVAQSTSKWVMRVWQEKHGDVAGEVWCFEFAPSPLRQAK